MGLGRKSFFRSILGHFVFVLMPMRDFFSWDSYGTTHIGNVRKINQDAYLDLPDQHLWLVADGMGGHEAGELASAAIVNALQAFRQEKWLGASVARIYRELLGVNRMLVEMAADNGHDSVVGSTVAMLLASRRHGVCLWSGDSRVYLHRRGCLRQLTRDHNYAAQMLAEGYSSEEADNNPYAQVLTHAVGADPALFLEAQIHEIRPGDIYLLCSDGLNKEVGDNEIETVLNAVAFEQALPELLELCLARGARDNTTIVLAGC
jgi:serine/threonine protein phosphatase PrpC